MEFESVGFVDGGKPENPEKNRCDIIIILLFSIFLKYFQISKRDITLLDRSEKSVRVTLWGDFVSKLLLI